MKKFFIELEQPQEFEVLSECVECGKESVDGEKVFFDTCDGGFLCLECYENLEKEEKYNYEEVEFHIEEKCFLGEEVEFRKWYDEVIDPIAKCEDLKRACFSLWGGHAHRNMREVIYAIYYTHACGDTLKVLPRMGLYSENNILLMIKIYKLIFGVDIQGFEIYRNGYGRSINE